MQQIEISLVVTLSKCMLHCSCGLCKLQVQCEDEVEEVIVPAITVGPLHLTLSSHQFSPLWKIKNGLSGLFCSMGPSVPMGVEVNDMPQFLLHLAVL